MVSPVVLGRLREILGPEGVRDGAEDRLLYAADATPLLERRPAAVLLPRTAGEVAAVLRLANEAGFSVTPRGAGTGLSGGAVPDADGVVLLLARWNRVLEVDEANRTAWVEPGAVLADLHRAVEARGLFYPPDPGSQAVCTIGGNVAENAGGLRGLKYGVTRNYVLGLECVLPSGEILRVGNKAVKDVAGYDLRHVLVGSEGTLGVFTRILLRLLARPEASVTFLAVFARLEEAAGAAGAILASGAVPAMLEFLDATTLDCVERYARLGLPAGAGALLLAEVDGSAASVADEADRVERALRASRADRVERARDAAEAARLKAARRAAFPALARVRPTAILEDATVPPSALPEMVAFIAETARRHGVACGNFGHLGDGNLHPTCLTDARDPAEILRVEKVFEAVFRKAVDLGGTITGEHGTGLVKRPFLPYQAGEAGIRLMRDLKRLLDPNAILNPGKVVEPHPVCEGRLPRRREQIPEAADA